MRAYRAPQPRCWSNFNLADDLLSFSATNISTAESMPHGEKAL